MADYEFRSLSPHDFEMLSRDLLQKPLGVRLENLEQAFHTFYEFRRQRFGFPTKPGDWVDALRELDGNFIKTGRVGRDIVLSFHNPSIRDFMEQFLEKSDADVLDLLRGAHFCDQ